MSTAVSECLEPRINPKSMKFPVFSLMIREIGAESCSHQTESSVNQSAISGFSSEKSKTLRTFARFLRLEGTADA
jgi:hypothetical protein